MGLLFASFSLVLCLLYIPHVYKI